MATATIYAGAGDGNIRRVNSGAESWATLRNATSGTDVGPTYSADFGVAARKDSYLYRMFLPFNLSGALPSAATITAVDVYVYVTAKASAGGGTTANNSVTVVESTQASNTTLVANDYDNVGSTELVAARSSFSGMTTSAYNAFSLNAAGIALAQAAADADGYFKIAMRSGYDLDNVAPTPDTAISDFETRFSEYASTTYDPYIVITYDPPARAGADAIAFTDSTSVTGGGGTQITAGRTGADTIAFADASNEYWRAKLQPVTVQAAGANTTLNGSHTFPTGTTTVSSTTGFPSSGTFVVSSSWTQTEVTYTGKTGTTFTGCTGGSGTFGSGSLVMARDSTNNFPQVTVLDETDTPDILVGWIQKPGHGGTIGAKIVGKTSTDGGRSWGSRSDIVASTVNSGWGIGGFVIARLKNGRLLIAWYEGSSGGLVRSYLKYSDDSGATWSSASAQLTSPYPSGTDVCAVGFARYVDTSGSANATYGDLYLTCYGNDSATYDNTATYNRLMKITDGGAAGTWTSVSTINTLAQLDGRASEEASLTVLDTGLWVSHLRVEVKAPTYTTLDRYQCTSSDQGATWTGHTLVHDRLANAAITHQMPELHLITQGADQAHGGQTITYFSTDRGTTWTDAAAYYRLEATDGTYSSGNGSDFLTIASTAVPGRRVLNVISQEQANQAAAQVRFQWYEVPNLPLGYDSLTFTDTAARATAVGKTGTDGLAFTDATARTITVAAAATDSLSLSDTATSQRIVLGDAADTLAWTDTGTRITSTGRTGTDTLAWTDTATRTTSTAGPGSFTLEVSEVWANGVSVGAYPELAFPYEVSAPSGEPRQTAVVGAGELAFVGLDAESTYWAFAGGRRVRFTTDPE